jgi:hypothetical protein
MLCCFYDRTTLGRNGFAVHIPRKDAATSKVTLGTF